MNTTAMASLAASEMEAIEGGNWWTAAGAVVLAGALAASGVGLVGCVVATAVYEVETTYFCN